MARENQFTVEGLEKLKAELEVLRGPERLRIADTIREAKSHGDLKENAAYHEAKLNQTRLERRISDLERAAQTARVVEHSDIAGVQLGSKVRLKDAKSGSEFDVTLVGDYEADPDLDRISVGSPLGLALAGKETGSLVELKAPSGVRNYTILMVS